MPDNSLFAQPPPSLFAQQAREAAAKRMLQATAPGTRQEGPITQWIVGQGQKIAEMPGSLWRQAATDPMGFAAGMIGPGEIGGLLGVTTRSAGKDTISYALNNMLSGKIRSAPIQVPEGIIHTEWNPASRELNIHNVNFESKGTGAFTEYLDHIEQVAKQGGASKVKMESIGNDRLIPFLEKRGYEINRPESGNPDAFKALNEEPEK